LNQRLATKLATYTILLGILIGSIVSATQIRDLYLTTTQEIDARAIQLIELTLDAAAEAVYQLDAKIANDLLNGLMQYDLILESVIYDELGQELARVSRPRIEFTGLARLIEIKPVEYSYSLPVRNGTEVAGVFTAVLDIQAGLQVFYDLAVSAAVAQILQAIGLSMLVFLIVVYLITIPVGKLAKTLSEIDPESADLLPVENAHRNDEIGNLINSANRYLKAVSHYQGELSDSKEELQDILDNLKEGVITVDLDGNILSANKASEQMFRYLEDSLLGNVFLTLFTGNEYSSINALVEAVRNNARITPFKLEGHCRDDHIFPIDVSVSLSNANRSVWTIKDLSEEVKADKDRRTLEGQLRQSQKMEAIGTLAGGIAHDFNNLLSGLTGFAELAQEEAIDESDQQDNINHIISISNQATQLARQILTFSRKKDEKKDVLNLIEVIEGCQSLIRQTIPSSIELNMNYTPADYMVFADETMIQQVMMNLYSNAAAAIGNHAGKITVSISLIEAIPPTSKIEGDYTRTTREYTQIKVKDSGSGIPKAALHRIFEPYYTTKAIDAGTGMGLAVVHSIIDNHHGWIEVGSSQEGTEFSICLPAADKVQKTTQLIPQVKQSNINGSECILVVDDNAEITKMLTRMLSKRGYEIITSPNGIDALRLFEADPQKIDLVITDQTMPGKNGDELASEMLNIRSDIPIILCTGYSDYFTKESALSLGIRKFMPKPVSNTHLAEAIRTVLDEPKQTMTPQSAS
jgi:PAS domain S-box-containing protein